MTKHIRNTVSLTISKETDRRLNVLKSHLSSPKSWIVERLVNDEIKRLRINLDLDKEEKLRLEVRAH